MSHYRHILLAADFSDYGNEVARKAKELAENNQAMLSIIHVQDNIPIADAAYGPIIPFDADFFETLEEAARQRLRDLGKLLDIAEKRQWLETGRPKLEIVRVAEENNVDLIVVGSHGRHGLALLLGSTANGVLHHACCDVLAVRLQNV